MIGPQGPSLLLPLPFPFIPIHRCKGLPRNLRLVLTTQEKNQGDHDRGRCSPASIHIGSPTPWLDGVGTYPELIHLFCDGLHKTFNTMLGCAVGALTGNPPAPGTRGGADDGASFLLDQMGKSKVSAEVGCPEIDSDK